ncbi:hypothetical protein UJ101_00993 [Flavobacteriaceae bacterium UJ101]|nr:hypothetical protein UJ101_00993 [Flavobacteriaceae bacterium UJ101]
MKRFFVILSLVFVSSFMLISCDNDDDYVPRYELFYDEITSAVVPETMTVGETYNITFSVELENSCQDLVDFAYNRIGNERYVTAISAESIYNPDSCNEVISTDDLTFRFTPTQETTYTFKFWKGQDVDGKDLYEIHEVVATQ